MSAIYQKGNWYGNEGSGHVIKESGTEFTQRETLDFIDHDLADDPVNAETKVKPHRITTEEMQDIMDPPGSKVSMIVPTGTLISFMGTIAPDGYLSCDGTVYNISDYQNLAEFFEEQFGTKNNFGGDGVDTFAVPDLRGEFLRGTGTNSHANQGNGANVGTHQDATENMLLYYSSDYNILRFSQESVSGTDSTISNQGYAQVKNTALEKSSTDTSSKFTTRPTNTSVLYCIKT